MTRVTHSDPETGACAVSTHDLSKRYGAETVLDRVGLRVPEGAVYVLVGANGAGKSTAIKLLLNLERPDSGTAQVLGMDTAQQGPEVRAQIGYVPERHTPGYPWMTCDRLLRHVAAYYPAWDHVYADELTRALDLRAARRIGGLSKGEARRLQLVLALAHRPPLLLLDEPTDGLDPVVRHRTLALLTEHLSETPTTVLISTHHVHEMENLADHVGVLRNGRLVVQLSRDAIKRTIHRYHVEIPDGWKLPTELRAVGPRRSRLGRETQWTLMGDEREITERLAHSGASVRDVSTLPLDDAALAFLSEDVA